MDDVKIAYVMHNLHSKITKKNTPKITHSEFVNTNLVKISKIQNKVAFLCYFFFWYRPQNSIWCDIFFSFKNPMRPKTAKFRRIMPRRPFEYISTVAIHSICQLMRSHNCEPFDTDPTNDKMRKPSRISSIVWHPIEISNRLIDNYERVIKFMKWLNDWNL